MISFHILQNYLNAFAKARSNGTFEGSPPSWMPDVMTPVYNNNIGIDETDSVNTNFDMINGNEENSYSYEKIQLKLLCGADLLESFATPGLWAQEDVSIQRFLNTYSNFITIMTFIYIFQLDTILGNHGIVVITRSGSNPEKFIYDSDMLTKHRVSSFVMKLLCDFLFFIILFLFYAEKYYDHY